MPNNLVKPYKPFFEFESGDIGVHPETPLKKKDIDGAIGKAKLNDYSGLYKDIIDQREGKK